MDPIVTAALIGFGGSVFNSAMSGGSFGIGGSKEYEYDPTAANIKLWKMQTEYNTPANQVARLRAAGLNPNLIYGTGSSSTGNATSAPQSGVPVRETTHNYNFDRVMELMQVALQMENMKAQNRNLNAQTADINAQTRQRNAQADYDNAVLEFYRKHGYFPGQTSAPSNVVREISNQMKSSPIMEHSAEALGSVVGRIVTNVDRDPDRAVKMAVKAADKKGLSGQSRVDYIKKFVGIYNRTH